MTFDLQEAREVLAQMPETLSALLRPLSDGWTTCDEGEGSFRPVDVVGHLLHGERTDWMTRVRHLLAHGAERPFEPFDRHGHEAEVASRSLGELLDAFADARRANLEALDALALSPEDLSRAGRHPALGDVTLRELLATWVVHDLGHLRQICRVMAGRYRNDVGPWQAYLPVLGEGPGAAH